MISSEWRAERDTTLRSVISDVEAELVDPTRLLSFLSRASAQWFLISVCVINYTGARVVETATKRVAVNHVRSGRPGAIFSQENAARGFEGVLTQLAATRDRNEIVRAMDFVVASWCAENMASALVLLHAALETAVSVVDVSTTGAGRPSTSQFGKLEEVVRKAIREFGINKGWSQALVEDLLEKTAELKRPPIVRVILRLLPMLDVFAKDLWIDDTDLEYQLRMAFNFRNRLVHAAEAEETAEANDRLLRLARLTERIILRILGVTCVPHESSEA